MNELIIDYSSMIIYCIKPNMTVMKIYLMTNVSL